MIGIKGLDCFNQVCLLIEILMLINTYRSSSCLAKATTGGPRLVRIHLVRSPVC